MKKNKEGRTLNKWSIVSYGFGNGGYNFLQLVNVYAMLFLTDYVGLNAGIVAMLIAVSKVLDGVTDVLAGTIIDRTRHKWGKARIWILRMIPFMVLTCIAFFFIPLQAPDTVKYIYFFITYTVYSDIFSTIFYVAHNTMVLYASKNPQERVFMSMSNFIVGTVANILVTGTYMMLIAKFGGGVQGWRMLAIVFSIIFVVVELIYVFSVKELPIEEEEQKQKNENGVLKDLVQNIGYLLKNRYFLGQLGIMFLYTVSISALGAAVPYYCIRVLGDVNNAAGTQTLLGLAGSGTIIGILFSAAFMKKFGLYKANLYTRIMSCACYILVIIGGIQGIFPLIVIGEVLFYLFQGPYLGTMGALIGEICNYSKLKDGVSIEATVSSCNSMGQKVGNALGVASVGWLLSAVHYDGLAVTLPQGTLNMITFIFIGFPIICQFLITVLLLFMNVEKQNEKLLAEKQVEV